MACCLLSPHADPTYGAKHAPIYNGRGTWKTPAHMQYSQHATSTEQSRRRTQGYPSGQLPDATMHAQPVMATVPALFNVSNSQSPRFMYRIAYLYQCPSQKQRHRLAMTQMGHDIMLTAYTSVHIVRQRQVKVRAQHIPCRACRFLHTARHKLKATTHAASHTA